MKTTRLLGLLVAAAAVPRGGIADANDIQVGRYQAFVGSEIRDMDDGTEDPGVWLWDTATGRIAFCQSGLINVVELEEWKIGEPRVSCTPWQRPSEPETQE